MPDIAIKVENLSKLYHIGRAQERHDTLRDWLAAGLRAPVHRLSSIVHRPSSDGDERRTTNDETIWALKDVSFEVQRGEVLGFIGSHLVDAPLSTWAQHHGGRNSILVG